MRGAAIVLLAGLALGAPGCVAVAPVERPAATAGLAPTASGGLQQACMGDEMLVLLFPLFLVAAPFLLVYAVVGTPVRVLARLRR